MRGVPSREKNKSKRGVQFVPTYCTYKCFVSSTSLVFNFGCSFSLVTAKGGQKCQRSVIDFNTDSSYLLVSPGLVGSSKRSPQTHRGVRRGGDEGEGGGGWGGSCWRMPHLGDSVPCHWAPVEGMAKKTTSIFPK